MDVSEIAASPEQSSTDLALAEANRRAHTEYMLRRITRYSLIVAVLIGVGVTCFHRGVVTAGLSAFGAALGVGAVLGFLFGVPSPTQSPVTVNGADTVAIGTGDGAKTISGNVAGAQSKADTTATKPASSTNTTSNLEQVADWVTKLLLGGGLTQMSKIPPKIWQWSHSVAMGILGPAVKLNEQMILAEQSFAAGLLIYGFILGFFGGFLITKLELGRAIS